MYGIKLNGTVTYSFQNERENIVLRNRGRTMILKFPRSNLQHPICKRQTSKQLFSVDLHSSKLPVREEVPHSERKSKIIAAFVSLKHWRIRIVRYFQTSWSHENLSKFRARCFTDRKISKSQNLFAREKKCWKIHAILYNWKTDDRVQTGVTLSNRLK